MKIASLMFHHQTRGPGTCRTQERPIKGHPYSEQRGSHSHYGQRRLPRKSKGIIGRPGNLQSLKVRPNQQN